MKPYAIYLMTAVLVLSEVFTACQKKEEKSNSVENQPPTCRITAPLNHAEFYVDESISVSVAAEDPDGSIVEVQLYVDNVAHSVTTTVPYTFTINAEELSTETHTLRAVATDNDGANGEASIVIKINPPIIESPDFISFSDGKIPVSWQTTDWIVDNTVGYDDTYSLKTTTVGAAVTAHKVGNSTINFVEFYLYGGSASFFIDGTNAKECEANSGWTKFGFYLSEGMHTLTWQSLSNPVYLDAIRFRTGIQCKLGMNYQGGIIAYVDNSGEHGFVAAPSNQSVGIQWYNGSYITTKANGTAIGTGADNTAKIVQIQGDGAYAAKICYDLVLNGYDDWFLPSKGELNELYKNRNVIDGFDTSAYWSSSESSDGDAWCQYFVNGYPYYDPKLYTYKVRAVRAF